MLGYQALSPAEQPVSPTLSESEHLQVIRCSIEAAGGKVVIAGTGANSTAEAITLTRAADQAGADAFLLVAPLPQ